MKGLDQLVIVTHKAYMSMDTEYQTSYYGEMNTGQVVKRTAGRSCFLFYGTGV